ncbi:MAG: hydantoinase/oxoprolinase family protein [Pseudomonadota bacterium]
MSGKRSIRIGVDIGGTFTDVALSVDGILSTIKVLTDYTEPEAAIIHGIETAAQSAGITHSDVDQVIHGTTLVTNALIERRGAKVAFITTQGFRDVIEMRSESRFEQYDLNLELPPPLVPRKDRYTLAERIAADGSVLLPLDDQQVAALANHIASSNYEAVAIGLIHAYNNDSHERRVAEALQNAAPDLPVSVSSVVSPQMRELERFNTVVANAYVQPQVASYLRRLVNRLRDVSINAPLFMMHSGGGLISVETAAQEPVRLLESGPSGGAIYAAGFARAYGNDQVVSFDMGGTTAKICLIEDGQPKTASSFEVARTYRFKKGSGMTVSTPVVEMVEIGAGGGSIAQIDAMGQIRVGPQSAGSEPGPACYQRGGQQPTVTDANLALGRLDPDNFAGGAIPLEPKFSKQAIHDGIANPGQLADEAAAFGITEIVDENMANAARVHAIENGRDIERYSMIAFGGGAPLHACRQCEKLGISELIIPPGAGVGSAIGFLQAPVSYEATKGLFQRLTEFDPEQVNATLEDLENEAQAFVDRGAKGEATETQLTAHMRYAGQGYEIAVPLKFRKFNANDTGPITTAFEEAYRSLFGRVIDGLPIEIANWSLVVTTRAQEVASINPIHSGRKLNTDGLRRRNFYDAGMRSMVEAIEVNRDKLKPYDEISGPALIVERETTIVVTAAFTAIAQTDGSILLQRRGK